MSRNWTVYRYPPIDTLHALTEYGRLVYYKQARAFTVHCPEIRLHFVQRPKSTVLFQRSNSSLSQVPSYIFCFLLYFSLATNLK